MQEAAKFVERYIPSGRVADIGALNINGSLRPLFPGCEYVGFDLVEGLGVDVVLSDAEQWGIPTDSFDVVVSANCLEHTRRPWVIVRNIARICRPGGLVLLIMPAVWPYHAHPIDCWRCWPEGMRGLLEDAELVVLDVHHNGQDTVGIARKPGTLESVA
jgi:SAM-dependent methyltransferase